MFLLFAVMIFLFPIQSNADSSMVDLDRIEKGESMFQTDSNFSDVLDNTAYTVNENTFIWSNIIPAIFTILFIIFLIRLGYALFTKVGSSLKGAVWGLISIPLIFIFLRIVGIFVLGESNIVKVDGYFNSTIALLSTSILFIAVAMLFIGILLRFSHRLIKHPAYHRWSNRLFLFSALSVLLSIIVEPVLYNI